MPSAWRNDMSSIKRTARLAGLLYVVMSALMVYSYMYLPATFLVAGDAAATARRITDGALLYRIGILSDLVAQILFVFVVLTLYQLFKDVNRTHAGLMVVLVCVGVAVEIVNLVTHMAPLILLSGADYLSVFSKPQLDALAMGSLRLGSGLGELTLVIWGLWLFPFGILAIRSGFFPRVLGYLLMVAGFAYVVTCITAIVFPAQLDTVSRVVTPLYLGELPIVIWLLVMGAKVPQAEAA
jgi:Domain of unknown function (DUF4386)